ncbi:transposase [Nonomuraea sp. NPDC050202]|uniref:transposase n=1 Tax=Nonomuraea sp. NPDC050202 TaxID=3155035 RepID=UPI0033D2774E
MEPLLPAPKRPGRPSRWSKRQLIDGIRWRVRVGAPWWDVPECYSSWQAVYSLFRRWQRAGIWQQILTWLQAIADAQSLLGWQVGVGSTICRAHQQPLLPRLRGVLEVTASSCRCRTARTAAALPRPGNTESRGGSGTAGPRSGRGSRDRCSGTPGAPTVTDRIARPCSSSWARPGTRTPAPPCVTSNPELRPSPRSPTRVPHNSGFLEVVAT